METVETCLVDLSRTPPDTCKVMKSKMPEGKGVPGVATRPAGNRGLPVLPLGL